jgi:hypothetical protein
VAIGLHNPVFHVNNIYAHTERERERERDVTYFIVVQKH